MVYLVNKYFLLLSIFVAQYIRKQVREKSTNEKIMYTGSRVQRSTPPIIPNDSIKEQNPEKARKLLIISNLFDFFSIVTFTD